MRKLSLLLLLLCALLATTGVVAAKPPEHAGKPEHASKPEHAGKPDQRNFVVHMTGSQEVPPVETEARGIGIFHLSKDGATLRWMITVTHIENVTMAHIHGRADAAHAAGVMAPLFVQTFAGEQNGFLMRGVITRGEGGLNAAAFDEMIAAMRDGEAYVNVHTTQHGSGEIRGQFGVKGGFALGRGESHGGGADTE